MAQEVICDGWRPETAVGDFLLIRAPHVLKNTKSDKPHAPDLLWKLTSDKPQAREEQLGGLSTLRRWL